MSLNSGIKPACSSNSRRLGSEPCLASWPDSDVQWHLLFPTLVSSLRAEEGSRVQRSARRTPRTARTDPPNFSWRDRRKLSLQWRRGLPPSILALVRSWCASQWLCWSARICHTDVCYVAHIYVDTHYEIKNNFYRPNFSSDMRNYITVSARLQGVFLSNVISWERKAALKK